jgi:hypothetical protein
MSLLVIDFTYLEGRDGEIVVKELAVADSWGCRVSSYVFKNPYIWENVPLFNTRIKKAMDHGCNWNDGGVSDSELETVLFREASTAVAIYCFGPQKTNFISSLIERTDIDITQLGCPSLADIITLTITFVCHKKSRHVCALRTAYSLAEWLNFYIHSRRYTKCTTQPAFH